MRVTFRCINVSSTKNGHDRNNHLASAPKRQRNFLRISRGYGCLGIKDTFFNFNVLDYELEEMIEDINESEPMVETDYNLVHNNECPCIVGSNNRVTQISDKKLYYRRR